jgi:hypothetical protein
MRLVFQIHTGRETQEITAARQQSTQFEKVYRETALREAKRQVGGVVSGEIVS